MCILNTRNTLCFQIYISRPIQIHHLGTSHKVVATSTSVSNNASELVIVVENNTVRTRGATSIDLATPENGEFVVGSRNGEVEPFIVVVLVRVVGDIVIRAVEIVSRFLGGADGTASVADCTASRGTCASFNV